MTETGVLLTGKGTSSFVTLTLSSTTSYFSIFAVRIAETTA